MSPLGRAVVLVAVSFYVACSLGSLDDLRGDGAAPDVVTEGPADSLAVDAPGDTGGDAGGLPKLQCAEIIGSRTKIATNVHADFVRTTTFLGGAGRVVLADYVPDDAGIYNTLVLRGYIVGATVVTPVALSTDAYSRVLASRRYSVAGHSGFAVLFEQGSSNLWVTRLPDDQTAWTKPIQLVNASSDGGSVNELQADLDVLDPTTDDYFIAYSTLTGNTQTVYDGEIKGTTTTLPAITSFNNTVARSAYVLLSPAVAYRNQHGYVMLNPGGNAGPPPPGSPAILVTSAGNVTITPPPSINDVAIGFADSVDAAVVNTAFLMANLSTFAGTFGVGQLATSSLGAVNPQALPSTTPTSPDGGPAGIADLFFFNPAAHWDDTSAGEQLVYVGAAVNLITSASLGGINLAWWDAASGAVRAYATSSGNLFNDVHTVTADAVVASVAGNLAQLDFAWAQVQGSFSPNFPPPLSDLWIAQVGCAK